MEGLQRPMEAVPSFKMKHRAFVAACAAPRRCDEKHVLVGWGSWCAWVGVQGADVCSLGPCRTFPVQEELLSGPLFLLSLPHLPLLRGCSHSQGWGLGTWGWQTLSSEHPILSHPIPSRPISAQQHRSQDQAHPGPRRAALSLLQQQQAPSHEEAERRWMQQSGAERQLITLPSVSCKLRAN